MKQTSFAEMRCSVARALDQVGSWWSLLIIRDAMMGARRFKDFESSLGIAKNTLTNRLKELLDNGILKQVEPENGSKYLDYELTEKGRDLAPIIMTLAQWGDKWSVHEDGPSFELRNKRSDEEISRLWPRDHDGTAIDLADVMLSREGRNGQETRTIAPEAGGLNDD
ncbi:helix-turn-helix domain-containing protein [Kordiimonas sp. SCSIO 12610]|uniref:winged helix-turn-helix transcriptional regulator n=1 Tax=Kordiimonas sp. SCSIO 12610 TaxID=2829597 RepID=UPI00210DA328|nr:helix-turn-helix domain-containing protein [Kordiimonas sp. SCSIO 12610]UTW56509.1 helix-turn-helix transcriptional regulator [Kordiimonas sp. SCSIO 12610]